MSLTPEQIATYHRDGYLVLPDLIDPVECDHLKARAMNLVRQNAFDVIKETFSTTNQGRPKDLQMQERPVGSFQLPKDEFFLSSATTISYFFEVGALDAKGKLVVPITQAINKIGHNLHDLDPVFSDFSRQPIIRDLVSSLGWKDPLLMQSMYIFKQPHIGGEVTAHQDGTFFYTEPDTSLGLWFAIEDATLENGCLWAMPGDFPLKSRFVVTPERSTKFRVYDPTPWELSKMVPLEVKKGTVIVLSSRCPHMSKANLSDKSRHAYTLHLIDSSSSYPGDNWLQRTDMRGF